jgi:hypothetical protein
MSAAALLLLAHAGHYWVWLLYVPPVAIVIFAIVRTSMAERREERRERSERGPDDPNAGRPER